MKWKLGKIRKQKSAAVNLPITPSPIKLKKSPTGDEIIGFTYYGFFGQFLWGGVNPKAGVNRRMTIPSMGVFQIGPINYRTENSINMQKCMYSQKIFAEKTHPLGEFISFVQNLMFFVFVFIKSATSKSFLVRAYFCTENRTTARQ